MIVGEKEVGEMEDKGMVAQGVMLRRKVRGRSTAPHLHPGVLSR